MLRRLIGEDIHLITTLDPGLKPMKIDLGQIHQIIMNLAINARDAMPHGGQLRIETTNFQLSPTNAAGLETMRPGDYVRLAISDTGVGMTEGEVNQAFEPFFTTKDVGQGSGLGLSMIYGFAKQSGGHARIYSEVGIGTTVKIYLPRSISDALAKPDPDASVITDIASRGETVMVVEDDDDVRIVAISFLENLGYLSACSRHRRRGPCTNQPKGGIQPACRRR